MRAFWDRYRRDFCAIVFLLAGSTAVFADILFGLRVMFIRDLTRYYYPTKRIIREVILGGEFPFWNRYYAAGQPMAANPEYEIFYPPQWLILLPDFDLGYRLHVVVHVWIAIVGMYLLLRSKRLHIHASCLGALGFALGGMYLSFVNLLPILFCATWIPWVFLFGRRFLIEPNRRDFALASLVLGIQMLAGEPTTLVQTWFLLGCYALYRATLSGSRWKAVVRNLLLVAAMGVGGLLIGCVQMFPALDHVGDSVRSRRFDFALVSAWSMPYGRPAELIYPGFFGHVFRDGPLYWGGTLYRGTASPFTFNFYPGLLLAVLALGAVFVRPRGGRWVLLLALLSYALALGDNTPLLRWLYDAGLVTSIRYLEKFSLIGIVVMTIFGAMMADRVLAGDRRLLRGAAWVAALSVLVALVIAIASLLPDYPQMFRSIWGLGATPAGARMVDASRIEWWLAVARGVIVLVVLDLVRRGRFRTVHAFVVGMLIVVDAWGVCHSVLPRHPREFFDPPAVVETFDSDRQEYRIFHEADWYGGSAGARRYFAAGRDIYWIVRNGLFPMTPASWGFRTVLERDYDKTALLPTVDLVASMWRVRDGGQKRWAEFFMTMSNARYRGSYRPFDEVRKETEGDFTVARPVAFVRSEPTPRYYFADRIESISGKDEFVEKLIDGVWTPRIAFVESTSFEPAEGEVLAVSERANHATIRARSEGDALLVMSVTPHKYWRATVNGREVPLETVNVGYQGIRLPAGDHEVVMRYRNTIVVATLPVAAGATLLYMMLACIPRRRTAGENAPLAAGSLRTGLSAPQDDVSPSTWRG